MMTGVPVKRIAKTEGMKLLQMHDELSESVVGQKEAIEKIVKAIHRNRAGLKDPNRPIGSFIFLGLDRCRKDTVSQGAGPLLV